MATYSKYSNLEEGMKALRDHVGIRNQMGGALYWNILNDECCQLANELRTIDGDYDEIAKILGQGSFQ